MESMKEIILSNGETTLIDDEDYELLNSSKWYFHNGYARHSEYIGGKGYKTKYIYMHRLLLDAPKGKEVDHINGNPLDNRRSNLRLASTSENHINKQRPPKNNTSGHIGVIWFEPKQRWHARIQVNGKSKHLGVFDELNDAIAARKAAEILYYGEFATIKA